jgi:anti-sigma factor RsiW
MSEPLDIERDPALWRRWRSAASGADGGAAPASDPLLLAAYAEGRLDETAAEPVEAWLASDAALVDDVQAAGNLGRDGATMPVPETVLTRAMALVDQREATVLSLRQPARRAPTWRVAAAWGSIAASLMVTGLVGFALGSDAYSSLLGDRQETALTQELFDPPSGFFSDFGEESNT